MAACRSLLVLTGASTDFRCITLSRLGMCLNLHNRKNRKNSRREIFLLLTIMGLSISLSRSITFASGILMLSRLTVVTLPPARW